MSIGETFSWQKIAGYVVNIAYNQNLTLYGERFRGQNRDRAGCYTLYTGVSLCNELLHSICISIQHSSSSGLTILLVASLQRALLIFMIPHTHYLVYCTRDTVSSMYVGVVNFVLIFLAHLRLKCMYCLSPSREPCFKSKIEFCKCACTFTDSLH